jgi:hypothetical protein
MISMTRTSIALAGLLALGIAAPAMAAPDRTVTLTPSTTSFGWSGAATTSISGQFWYTSSDPAGSCHTFPGAGPAPSTDAVDYCDETLVKLDGTGPGSLDVQLPTAGDGVVTDWDLYVYTADDAGNPGELIASSENTGGAEDVPIDDATASDNYLVVAVPYQSVNDSFTGSVSFVPLPADATGDSGS